jgi:hypothetical protein
MEYIPVTRSPAASRPTTDRETVCFMDEDCSGQAYSITVEIAVVCQSIRGWADTALVGWARCLESMLVVWDHDVFLFLWSWQV